MWDWTMDWNLLLLAVTLLLCGLVPCAMAGRRLAREEAHGPDARRETLVAGLPPALHAAVTLRVRWRLETLGAAMQSTGARRAGAMTSPARHGRPRISDAHA